MTFPLIFRIPIIALAAFCLPVMSHVFAQENMVIIPPPPLSPPDASGDAIGEVDLRFLRRAVEQTAVQEICATFEVEDGEEPLTAQECRASLVNGDNGIKWRNDGRPNNCGRDCMSAPRIRATEFRDTPNYRYANISGHLGFDLDVPFSFDRSVRYPYDLKLRCRFNGTSSGEIDIDPKFRDPILSEPGFGEEAVDFFLLPFNVIRFFEGKIKEKLLNPSPDSVTLPSRCNSIGVVANAASDFQLDKVIWDEPELATLAATAVTADFRTKTATVIFDKVERKSVAGSNPQVRNVKFEVFINGAFAKFPSIGGIDLETGDSQTLNLCKKVSLASEDNLQIIIVDNFDGAVWSQFTRQQNFGKGGSHTITTGRNAFLPPFRPGDKPTNFSAREFELTYRILVHDPNAVVATPGGNRGPAGPITAVDVPEIATAELSTGLDIAPAPGVCEKI